MTVYGHNEFALVRLKAHLTKAYNDEVENVTAISSLKYSHLVKLEDIIQKRLRSEGFMTDWQIENYGTSVDLETLRRLFSPSFTITERRLPTLHKLAIFLKFRDWFDFLSKKSGVYDDDSEYLFGYLLREIIQERILIFKGLPKINEELIRKRYTNTGEGFKLFVGLKCAGEFIVHIEVPDDGESLLRTNLITIVDNVAIVETKELWEITCFENIDLVEDSMNENGKLLTYTFRLEDNAWKIVHISPDPLENFWKTLLVAQEKDTLS